MRTRVSCVGATMSSLPFRKLERNLRFCIVSVSICLVTWLMLANGRHWQEQQQLLMNLRNRDLSVSQEGAPSARGTTKQLEHEHLEARTPQKDSVRDHDPLQYSMDDLMAWSPRQIRNLTHPFTHEMSRYSALRVIPVLYKKQLSADQRLTEGNIYLPGRDVIVALGSRVPNGGGRGKGKTGNTRPTEISAKDMVSIKRTLQERLREHARRLQAEPISFDRRNIPPALRYLDPKIIEIFPERFLEDYKNPCWWESRSLQCVPYFYIGGAPKCATTDMWNRLSEHPDVIRSFGKESHFWSRGNHSEKEVHSFLSRNKRVFKNQGGPLSELAKKRVSMDASACTFWHNYRAARILGNPPEGPPILLADVIRAAQPGARFIFILRNPTERQYSEYLDIDDLWKGRVKSPSDFHSRIENGIRLFDLCLRENTFRHCVAINAAPRLHISMYSVHLREWFQRFPREQIHILRTDEWKQNVTRELNNILAFLDLHFAPAQETTSMDENLVRLIRTLVTKGSYDKARRVCSPEYCDVSCDPSPSSLNTAVPLITSPQCEAIPREAHLKEIVDANNAGVRSSRNAGMGPMLPQTKALLDDYFSVFRSDLADLLEDERYLWSDRT